MWKNYFKIALRNLRKHKVSTVINVGGLALGLACCILLFLFVRHEWTFDRFHEKADRIHRLIRVEQDPGGARRLRALNPPAMASALEEVFPEVEETVRFGRMTASVTHGEQTFEEDVLLADPAVFDVFTFPFAAGNPETALDDPNSVVLSEEAARKYFGSENPIGRRLTVAFEQHTLDAVVTGVTREAPANSSIAWQLMMPYENIQHRFAVPPSLWQQLSHEMPIARTYVLLPNPERAEALESKLPAFAEERPSGEALHIVGGDEAVGLRLQPLTEVHLSPEVTGGLTPASNPMYSYILAGIALLVLGIACINFMTLALGRSAGRALEVGIRKVVGARREQVAAQFWGEALLTSTFALILGLTLAQLFLPAFNRLADADLAFDLFGEPALWLVLAGLALVVGLVAGGYPALVLSGFRPTEVLKGTARLGGRRWLTRGLVVVQFALSIAFVAGALIMSDQLTYLSEKELGFNEEHVVAIYTDEVEEEAPSDEPGDEVEQGPTFYERFRTEALRYPSVQAVAGAFSDFPGSFGNNLQLGDTAQVRTHMNIVSDNFVEVMQIDLLSGRDLSADGFSGEGAPALVNEALVRALGWTSPEAALGKDLPLETFMGGAPVRVVGVVENFHFESLHQEISPFIVQENSEMARSISTLLVRIAPEDIVQTLARLESVWQEVAPGVPFAYEFLDEVIAEQYRAEERWQAIVRYAAGFALVIACFGLFGLAALTAERRTKEIGIRKVLGASVPSIVALLSKDFLTLVGLAFVIAAPVAYYAMSTWLEDFAYRIELGAGVFLLAGALALLIALATVSYQALRAATANPTEALRSE